MAKKYVYGSGFVGVEMQEEADPRYVGDTMQYVKAAVGWAIYEEKPENEKPK
jgi:hypothetical protein